ATSCTNGPKISTRRSSLGEAPHPSRRADSYGQLGEFPVRGLQNQRTSAALAGDLDLTVKPSGKLHSWPYLSMRPLTLCCASSLTPTASARTTSCGEPWRHL